MASSVFLAVLHEKLDIRKMQHFIIILKKRNSGAFLIQQNNVYQNNRCYSRAVLGLQTKAFFLNANPRLLKESK